jgi:hypothetical protein
MMETEDLKLELKNLKLEARTEKKCIRSGIL